MAKRKVTKTPAKTVTSIATGPDRQWEALYRLRDVTRRLGVLSELQVRQLQMWPLVFTNATDSDCEFGFETQQVIFNLRKLKGPTPKDLKVRLQHLTKATQQLLGSEYGVVVNIEGKKVFYGPALSIDT